MPFHHCGYNNVYHDFVDNDELDTHMFRTIFAVASFSAALALPAFAEDTKEAVSKVNDRQEARVVEMGDKLVADISKDDILSFLVMPDVSENAQIALTQETDDTLFVLLDSTDIEG